MTSCAVRFRALSAGRSRSTETTFVRPPYGVPGRRFGAAARGGAPPIRLRPAAGSPIRKAPRGTVVALGPRCSRAGCAVAYGAVRLAERRDRLADRAFEIHAGFHGESRTELVLEDAGAHLVDEPLFELAELERSEREPDQPVHLDAEMLQDALDLAVLAFAECEAEPDVVALNPVERSVDGAVLDPVDRDAALQPIEIGLAHVAVGASAMRANAESARGSTLTTLATSSPLSFAKASMSSSR